MFLLMVLSAFSASTYTLGKILLNYSPPIFLISVRLIISGIIFLAYYFLRNKAFPKLYKQDYLLFAQVSFFCFYFAYIMEFWSLQYMSSAKTAFLYSLSPAIAALFSYYIFHEKMTFIKACGLALSLIGTLPIIISTAPAEGTNIIFVSLPELAIFAAIVSFSYGWVVIRKGIKKHALPIIFINGVGMFFGGIAALITAYIVEIPQFNPAWISPLFPVTELMPFIFYSALLILFGNIICYLLYGYLLERYTATLVTFGELITPAFAALFGWFFLSESISVAFIISMTILMIGLFLVYNEEKRQGYFDLKKKS